jgi:hypothetical protein
MENENENDGAMRELIMSCPSRETRIIRRDEPCIHCTGSSKRMGMMKIMMVRIIAMTIQKPIEQMSRR